MNGHLVEIVDRRLGEHWAGTTLQQVFVVDILACGHEVWHDTGVARAPYGITTRRRCLECGSGVAMDHRQPGRVLR